MNANEELISRFISSISVTRQMSSMGRRLHMKMIDFYGEQRFVTLGLLKGIAVSIVHTETPEKIRIVSFRKATRNEKAYLFKSIQN